MQAHIFQTISGRLQTLSAIKWIDWNQGQISNKHAQMRTPAVLLSMAQLKWKSNLENTQEGTLRLHVDIYLPNMLSTQQTSVGRSDLMAHTDRALQLLSAIAAQLHGISTEYMLGLTRIEETSLSCDAHLWGFRQTYCAAVMERLRPATTRRITVPNLNLSTTDYDK